MKSLTTECQNKLSRQEKNFAMSDGRNLASLKSCSSAREHEFVTHPSSCRVKVEPSVDNFHNTKLHECNIDKDNTRPQPYVSCFSIGNRWCGQSQRPSKVYSGTDTQRTNTDSVVK